MPGPWRLDKKKWQAMLAWVFFGALFALCGILGVLQYRWIGEVSIAERERLAQSLQLSLNRLSRDFNSEITSVCRAILPSGGAADLAAAQQEMQARYQRWKAATRHGEIFHRIAIAVPDNEAIALRTLDLETGALQPAQWPEDWKAIRKRLEARRPPGPWEERGGPGPRSPGVPPNIEGTTLEMPIITARPFEPPPGPFPRRQAAWAIFDFNLEYIRDTLLPEILQTHLGSGGSVDYQVEVVSRGNPALVIYRSDPNLKPLAASADASVGLFEVRYDELFRRREPARPMRGRGMGPGGGPGPEFGRWRMFVRHRAGSLEVVVARARWRNLAVNAGVLLLMMASVAALIRYTRRAQRLAELQMEFVAGVSHELRTPLTVINTAGYNLRGRIARNPEQVERYGALIQKESGRLRLLVEQVLRFAAANAGQVIREPEPVSVESVIEESMESSKGAIQGARCVVEKNIDRDLPLVMGDPLALKHAFENLLNNAAKYGAEGSNWIGVYASRTGSNGQAAVEIRVADRGPGIPKDEQKRIFDPFFRGRRAVTDQVHGTGLGLNLVKKIVEAHGGSISVRSEPMKGTEFIVRIPAAATESQDEFAHSPDRG